MTIAFIRHCQNALGRGWPSLLCGLALWLGLSGVVAAAASHVASTVDTQGGGSISSVSLGKPAGVVTNDLLITQIGYRSSTATITPPSGWTLIRKQVQGTLSHAVYYKYASATEPASYTWSFSAFVRLSATVSAFRGVQSGLAPLAQGSTGNTGSSVTAPALSFSIQDVVLLTFHSVSNGNSSFGAASGMSEFIDWGSGAGPNGAAIAGDFENFTAVTSTPSKTATAADSGSNSGISVVFSVAPVALDHIRISHDGSGLTCSAETVTVTACADAACSAVASTDVVVTLSPGGWLGGNSFTIPAGSSGGVSRNLSITTAQTVTLGTSAISPTATNATRCFVGAVETCQLTFADSGFVFDVPNHVSDTSQSVTVSAVKKDDAGQACVPGFASVTRTLDFYSNPINPTTLPPSGAQSVRVGGTTIAGSSPGTGVALNFNANGQASTTVSYADAGTMRLFASYTGSAGTGDAGLVMTGQDDFIARPNDLVLSVTGNPAATVPADPVFTQAGTPFAITVTARNASGNATSNFGRETAPASVTLATTLVAPVGGLAPAITADPGFGAFSAGSASGNWSWSEVGIISLLPQLAGSDYLGAGDVTGVPSGNIGRFVPHHFTVTGSDRCGSFSYAGQPFSATVSAASVSGALTQNYAGSYAKEVTLSRAIGTSGTLAGNVIATTPGLFSAGTATLDKTVIFTFDTPPEPPLVLSLRATDSDGVSSSGFVEGGTEIRSGRLRLVSGFGSGLAPLALPLRVESWQNIATLPATVFAWATETTDTCTAPLLTTGSFTVTGIGTTVSAASLNPDGTGSLTLTAPGSAGQADITACLGSSATAPVCASGLSTWLQFDWNGDGTAENPTARAGFELNPGNQRQIYRREVIN